MVFNIKMEDFRHKTRLVSGGHINEAPATIIHASVVSRKTVRIALMVTTLNDLEVKSDDILNTYIQAPLRKNAWTTLGPEFKKNASKTAVIVRTSYGLKSAQMHGIYGV